MSDQLMDDTDHLRLYATQGSEDAFAALVQRYLPLVYAAALRRVGGDTHRAQDVAQLVFTALARNAAALAKHPDLTGWLFTTTRFLAAKAVRGERRRQSREQQASLDHEIMNDEPANETGAPLHAILDDVTMELRQLDRQVILLRFHRGLRLAEIGAQLGATENAVQKRIDRALDQLKDKLARRGVTSTAAALALAFEQQGAVAMPAGLAAAATTAGLACGTGTGSLLAVSTFVTISKLQLTLAASVVAASSGGLFWQVRENAVLQNEMARQAAATQVRTTELTQQLAALTQRADAAEADAVKMQKALAAANAARAATPPARVLTDSQQEVRAAMMRASKLTQEGKFQEALDEYLKTYRELAGKPNSIDRQLLMSAIKSLGNRFPPALTALGDLRDTAMKNLQAAPDSRDLISEIGLLNERLGDGRASMALYDTLPEGSYGRQSLGLMAHKSFVEARRYADALVGKTFGAMLNELDMGVRMAARQQGQDVTMQRDYVVAGAASNIEVLTGAGKLEDARVLTEKLLAFDSSDRTRATIKQHVDRASQTPAP